MPTKNGRHPELDSGSFQLGTPNMEDAEINPIASGSAGRSGNASSQ